MKKIFADTYNWLGGLQWLMFIFVNTVVVPITIGAAYDLPQKDVVSMMQFSFILGGIACVLQAWVGHKRAIMSGPSGLWWGVILALTSMSAAQGVPLDVVGGSLAVGIFISGILTIIVGLTGLGYYLQKLFNPGVMGTFMFLFGVSLCINFFKGMLGLPYGGQSGATSINLSIGLFSILLAILVLVLTVKAPGKIAQFSLLIGIVIGWPIYALIFHPESQLGGGATSIHLNLFPIGDPAWNIGIIVTVVMTGILNLSKQYGSIKGSNEIYQAEPTTKDYRNSFTITGIFVGLSGFFGLVPFSPFVSSIGFLQQTGIIKRLPFIFGGVMFFVMGIIPPVGYFFTLLPLSVGSAVLFVSYVQLFGSARDWFAKLNFNSVNIYRTAVPLFTGIILMTLPSEAFETLPGYVRPLLSNGLLMGTLIALLLENLFRWDRYGSGETADKPSSDDKTAVETPGGKDSSGAVSHHG